MWWVANWGGACVLGQPDLVALAVEGRHPLPGGRAARLPQAGGRGRASVSHTRRAHPFLVLVWFKSASVQVGLATACT